MANRLNVQNIYASDSQSTPSVTIDANGISAGTLGSGVVFPAGHVLQVVHTETTETNTLTTTHTNYYEVPLTLKSSSSDVIVSFTFNYYIANTNQGLGLRIYRGDSPSVTTSDTAVWTRNATDTSSEHTIWSGSGNLYSVSTITGKDTITGKSAGETIYYGLFAKKYTTTSGVNFPPTSNVSDGFFSSLIMEVQK